MSRLSTLISIPLFSICSVASAIEPSDIAKAVLCDKAATKTVSAALTSDNPPKWIYLISDDNTGAILGSDNAISAFNTNFNKFHWYSSEVMTNISLLIDRSRLPSIAKAQGMKPLPGSFLNIHYRTGENGQFFVISHRVDSRGKLLKEAGIRCVSGYKNEEEFVRSDLHPNLVRHGLGVCG